MSVSLTNSAGQFGTSEFIVSPPNGSGQYWTIQAAVTAATTAGSGTVIIQPGTYTESISWPSTITLKVLGDSTGIYSYPVEIVGNQTIAAGSAAFQNIWFSSSSGSTWTTSGISNVDFDNCQITSASGNCITSTSTGTINLIMDVLSAAGGNALNIASTTVNSTNSTIASSSTNAVSIGVAGDLNATQCTFISSSSDILLTNASAEVISKNCSYIATNNAWQYTANATVVSVYDSVNASGAYYASSSGAGVGILEYSYTTLTGTATAIDPNISQTAFPTKPTTFTGLTWTDRSASATVLANSGSFSTAAISLTLPASPAQGSVCQFIVDAAGVLSVVANTGQLIRVGNVTSASAGMAQSSAQGDSISLVYRSSDTTWIVQGIQGNWAIS